MVHPYTEKYLNIWVKTKNMQAIELGSIRKKILPDIDTVNILYVDIAGPTDMDPRNNAG